MVGLKSERNIDGSKIKRRFAKYQYESAVGKPSSVQYLRPPSEISSGQPPANQVVKVLKSTLPFLSLFSSFIKMSISSGVARFGGIA